MNRRGHLNLNHTLALTGAVLGSNFTDIPFALYGCLAAGMILGETFLSNDLDLRHSRTTKAWGYLRWIWYPYSRIKHRSSMSHGILIGTIGKISYLFCLAITITTIALTIQLADSLSWQALTDEWLEVVSLTLAATEPFQNEIVFLLSGLVISDIVHTIADWTTSYFKSVANKT